MTLLRKSVRILAGALAIAACIAFARRAHPQAVPPDAPLPTAPKSLPAPPATPPMSRNVIVLDAAHGGPDAGAKLGDQLLEKDVTLALAARLRTSLTAAGFTVVSTREADSFTPLSTDQRAEAANRAHAGACLVLHVTGTGAGVHLYTSPLDATAPAEPISDAEPGSRPPYVPTPWDTAQAASIPQSLRLSKELSSGLAGLRIPALERRAPVKPLDNLLCPAVAIEVAPLGPAGGDRTPVSDPGYQQRLADALTRALQSWRGKLEADAVHTSATPPAEVRQ